MTKRHRRHGIAKKREVVEACLNGEERRTLSQRHDVCRSLILIRIWIEKCEGGACDVDAVEADLLSELVSRSMIEPVARFTEILLHRRFGLA